MPVRAGSSTRVQALYNDPDLIVIKRKPYIKKLINFYRYSAAHNHLESFIYGPISHMLVTYAEACEPTDPNAAVCFVPQGCLEAVLGLPSEANPERRRRRFSDGYFALTHDQTVRSDQAGYRSPSVGSWVEAKAVRGITDFFGVAARVYAAHAILTDIAQVCEQVFFAMLNFPGDVFYGVVFYGARFFCFKFTRPADWDNVRAKYRGKPFSAEFDAVDYPIPETMYSNESVFSKDLSDLSPMWKDTVGLMTSPLQVSHQPSWFQIPPGYRRGKSNLTAANKAIAAFKDSVEEKAAPEDISFGDGAATATPAPGSAYDPSTASLRAIAKLPRCNFDLRPRPNRPQPVEAPADEVPAGTILSADAVASAPDGAVEVKRRQARRVPVATVQAETDRPTQAGPHPSRLRPLAATRPLAQAQRPARTVEDPQPQGVSSEAIAVAGRTGDYRGRPIVPTSRLRLIAGTTANATHAHEGAGTSQSTGLGAPPPRRLPRYLINGPLRADDPLNRPNPSSGHRIEPPLPAPAQPGPSRLAETAPVTAATANRDFLTSSNEHQPGLSRAALTDRATVRPSRAVPIGAPPTDSAGVARSDGRDVRRVPKRTRPASPHEDEVAASGAVDNNNNSSPAGPSKRPRTLSGETTGPAATTACSGSRAAPSAGTGAMPSGAAFPGRYELRRQASTTRASSRGRGAGAHGQGKPGSRLQ